VKLRRPLGTALRASESIWLKYHSTLLPKKKSITLATAAVRLRRPQKFVSIEKLLGEKIVEQYMENIM